jgi:hypothetical protein
MPLVTDSCPSVKASQFNPFRVLIVTLATVHAVAMAESVPKSLLEQMRKIAAETIRFMSTSPTPQGLYDFECRLVGRLRQVGLVRKERTGSYVYSRKPRNSVQILSGGGRQEWQRLVWVLLSVEAGVMSR